MGEPEKQELYLEIISRKCQRSYPGRLTNVAAMNLKESKGWENGRRWREEKGENDVIILKSKKIKRNDEKNE